MSKNRIINALKQCGFSNTDTQVYVFLAKQGPQKISEIASKLNLNERKIQKSLKELHDMKVVKALAEKPQKFTAVSFKELIALTIEVKKEQAKALQASKQELLSSWKSITKKENNKN